MLVLSLYMRIPRRCAYSNILLTLSRLTHRCGSFCQRRVSLALTSIPITAQANPNRITLLPHSPRCFLSLVRTGNRPGSATAQDAKTGNRVPGTRFPVFASERVLGRDSYLGST